MEYSGPVWNIFARELDGILRKHDSWIGQLDNNEVRLHPQTVQRLLRSLKSPKPLVVLNPEVLTTIFQVYDMQVPEQRRLKAAILATAVERVLMDRIEASLALMISNNAFETLLAAFEANPALAALMRQGNFIPQPLILENSSLALAADLIDQAVIDLHLTLQTTPAAQQQQAAMQTVQAFRLVIDVLEQCTLAEKQTPDWHYWYNEAEHGSQQGQALLKGAV